MSTSFNDFRLSSIYGAFNFTGTFLGDFRFFSENIGRRSVKVLKLDRGIILTKKKRDINPQKNSETPLGVVFNFFC
jgi:hypothetical protein